MSPLVSYGRSGRTVSREPEAGFEPTTYRLQGGCSDQLSYSGAALSLAPAGP